MNLKLVLSLAASAVFMPLTAFGQKGDPAAYALLEKASRTRQTMPDDVTSVSGKIVVLADGKELRGSFTYSTANKAEVQSPGLDDKGLAELKAQVGSIFAHRTRGDFAKGNGRYPISFADSVVGSPGDTRRISVSDDAKSFFRVKGDEIVEVDREMHGNRFVISMLETIRTPDGKSLPKVFAVSYFDANSKGLSRVQYYNDDYVSVNGVWVMKSRRTTTVENGKTDTVEVRFDEILVQRG